VKVAQDHEYEMGVGIRDLAAGSVVSNPGELIATGQQNVRDGQIGLAIYFDPGKYAPVSAVRTPDGSNRAVIGNATVGAGHVSEQIYAAAGAWSGTGIENPGESLKQLREQVEKRPEIDALTFARTPHPEKVDAEAQ
jgi:hypothetical protein